MDQTAVKPGTPARGVDPAAIQATSPLLNVPMNGSKLPSERAALEPAWKRFLAPAASLKLTVFLFACSMVIVFYGTWAQVDQGIWYVVSQYFRSYFVMIPVKVILFQSIDESPFSIPFPGGWTLGVLLLINLLAAHAVRFKMTWRRSGIFVLHAGIIIMFISEFITGSWATEGMMQIEEKKETNYTQDAHNAELAFVNIADPKFDDTVAIPHKLLVRERTIRHEKLPFDVELVDKYQANSVEVAAGKIDNPATAGFGADVILKPAAQVSGANPEQRYDQPAAYIKFLDKTTGKTIDTYAVRMGWKEQKIKVGDQTYEIALRPKRTYKNFSVYLEKASFKKYPGTEKTKDFSSFVKIKDLNGEVLRTARIYMNNPLYYDGETYFQSQMDTDPRRPITTGLQVVYNPASGMPLLSLTMVGLGMLIHFGIHLIGFLQRRMAT